MSLFSTLWPPNTIPVYKGKKKEHVQEILFALAHLGPSKTHDIAKYILPKTSEFKDYIKIPYPEIKKRAAIYNKLILGRTEKNKGKSRKTKSYLGLISAGYVIQTGTVKNEKGNEIPLYFLTLKGCFTALGFDSLQFEKFIKNSSKNHLYFMFLNILNQNTSKPFVLNMFGNPIIEYIKKNRISFKEEEIYFYFTMIIEATINELRPLMRNAMKRYYWKNPDNLSSRLFPILRDIEIMMDNNYYYERPKEDWVYSIIEKWYPNSKDKKFYLEYCDFHHIIDPERELLLRLMAQIHFSYNVADEKNPTSKIPRFPRYKLPRSREWKNYQKFKQN